MIMIMTIPIVILIIPIIVLSLMGPKGADHW